MHAFLEHAPLDITSVRTRATARDLLHCIRICVARRLGSQKLPLGGSGPYPSTYSTSPTLKRHTIYAPINPPPDKKLPLLIWANGGGWGWGLMFSGLLREIASHGYVVIANGDPRGLGLVMGAKSILDAVSWISQPLEGTLDVRTHIDTSHIAIAGHGKGGRDAFCACEHLRGDERVRSIGVFNAGLLPRMRLRNPALVKELNRPVFYFIGGPRDLGYVNAEADWEFLPKNLPAFKGNLNVGHMATYYEKNGGEFGEAALNWLDYALKGDERAKERLLAYASKQWNIQARNL